MDFTTKLFNWDGPLGCLTLAKLVPAEMSDGRAADGAALLAASQALRPNLYYQMVLDVSGSMEDKMEHLVNTALGSVDIMPNGSALRVIVFDDDVNEIVGRTTVTADNRAAVKALIKERVINRGGGTDLSVPLTLAFTAETGSATMLLTDGLATSGHITSSDGLLRLSRRLPNYTKNVAHTLGLQVNEHDLINAALLKDLALDTSGVFAIGHDVEIVSTFVGDVLADHYMRRYEALQLRLASERLVVPKLLTAAPLMGFVLRADRELALAYEWPAGPVGPTAGGGAAPMTGGGVHMSVEAVKVTTGGGPVADFAPATLPEPAGDAEQATLLAAYAAAKIAANEGLSELKAQLETLLKTAGPAVQAKAAIALTELEAPRAADNSGRAAAMYRMSSGHGDNDTTPAVACMRYLSATASSSQAP